MNRTPRLLIPVVWLCTFAAFAQNQPRELQVSRAVVVTGEGPQPAIFGPFKCDGNGSIYVRFRFKPQNRADVVSIAPEGSRVSRFRVEATRDLAGFHMSDYAPDSHGNVTMLGFKTDPDDKSTRYFLAQFDKDGNFRSLAPFAAKFRPMHIAAFGTGDFLISGEEIERRSETVRPYLAVFNSAGELLRRVMPNDDISIAHIAAGKNADAERMQYESAIATSSLQALPDGNAFVLRRAQEGPVLVVSPAGTVNRTIKLTPPSNSELISAVAGPGSIVAVFAQRRPVLNDAPLASSTAANFFSIYSESTGELIAQYRSTDPVIGAALGCYVDNTFSFLHSTSQALQIVHAAVR